MFQCCFFEPNILSRQYRPRSSGRPADGLHQHHNDMYYEVKSMAGSKTHQHHSKRCESTFRRCDGATRISYLQWPSPLSVSKFLSPDAHLPEQSNRRQSITYSPKFPSPTVHIVPLGLWHAPRKGTMIPLRHHRKSTAQSDCGQAQGSNCLIRPVCF